MIIRIDDYPTGVRPFWNEKIYEQIFDHFEKRKIPYYLGIVPALLSRTTLNLKKYKMLIPCQHGYDHRYHEFSKVLIDSKDHLNVKTIGVFDEFEGKNESYQIDKLSEGRKILTDYFKQSIKYYIPVCNIVNPTTKKLLNSYELITEPSCYYGHLKDFHPTGKEKIVTLHITWEAQYIKENSFDKWTEIFDSIFCKNINPEPKKMIDYKILFKYPTRQRPELFLSTLNKYIDMMSGKNHQFIINIDEDDKTMNNEKMLNKLKKLPKLEVKIGQAKNKIEACNAFVPESGWDIIVLVSDDMIPVEQGFDDVIRNAMTRFFSDTDGVLFFNDGHQEINCNTLTIMGKKYYDRFGYLYNPQYKTVGCDRELTDVAFLLNKQKYFKQCIIEHQHHIWTKKRPDELYKRNDNYKMQREDDLLYTYRKSLGFPKGIPKIAYFYWNNETPLSYLRYQTLVTFRDHHPEWRMELWTSKSNTQQQWKDIARQEFSGFKGKDYLPEVEKLGVEIKEYTCEYDVNPNYISDIFRYNQLYKTGGWWFDLDQIILKNFDSLTSDYEFVFGGKTIVYNGVIGACYHSEICAEVIEQQKKILSGKLENYCQIGNWLLSSIFNKKNYLFKKHIFQASDEVFYPILESHNTVDLYEGKIDFDNLKNTYAVHWFAGHPHSQEFNKKFTPEFVKKSNDSISNYLRNGHL